MVECYISSNPFYSATMPQNATEQYVPGPGNADAGQVDPGAASHQQLSKNTLCLVKQI